MMYCLLRAAAAFIAPTLLLSCTSLYAIHDPQTGIISAGQLPGFIKSVRCELVTFYEIERSRMAAYENAAKAKRAYSDYAYFNIAPKLYGAFTLELKVTDSLGIGAGTSIDSKHVSDATHSDTLHVGPTLSGQGTHDLIWTYLMKQDAKLSVSDPRATDDSAKLACFKGPLKTLEDLENLAEENPTVQAQFTRILVDGRKPLAAWLRDNGILMSTGDLSSFDSSESAEPAQMYYSFAVQVIAGVEAKYSVLTPQWNPLAIQGTGSLQQNSNLQIYINGPGAAYANAAKAGTAGFPSSPPLGSAANPMHIINEKTFTESSEPNKTKKGTERESKKNRFTPLGKGYLMAPLPVFPPSPSQ